MLTLSGNDSAKLKYVSDESPLKTVQENGLNFLFFFL